VDPEFIRDLFAPFGPVVVRRMFGGAGLFREGLMFGLVFDGALFLRVDADSIPDFESVNARLEPLTGWRIVGVPGLIPDAVFYDHLAHRRFPVTVWIRSRAELDYLVEPDLFHDFFGHVPLLSDPVFADYMQAYGQRGVEAGSKIDLLARLYWYTVEFGLIRDAAGLGYGVDAGSPWLRVTACAGRPGCASALADVQADAAAFAARWPERIVHVSGCARHCGRPVGPLVDVTATSEGYQVAGI